MNKTANSLQSIAPSDPVVSKFFNSKNFRLEGEDIFGKVKIFLNLTLPPLFLLFLWHMLSSSGIFLEVILPSPVKVAEGFWKMIKDGTLAIDLRSSGYRILVGYFWGSFVGLFLGVVSGLSKVFERMVSPLVVKQVDRTVYNMLRRYGINVRQRVSGSGLNMLKKIGHIDMIVLPNKISEG